MNEQELKTEVGDVGEVSPRDVREADLADVAARNLYKALGYKELDEVPETVRRSTKLAIQQTLHGLNMPVLMLDPKVDSVLLIGVDVGKHGEINEATKILGKFKSLFPRARIIAYDSNHLSISELNGVLAKYAEKMDLEAVLREKAEIAANLKPAFTDEEIKKLVQIDKDEPHDFVQRRDTTFSHMCVLCGQHVLSPLHSTKDVSSVEKPKTA